MHTIDIVIVIVYLALCILIGLYKSRSIKTLKEYTLGKGYFPDIVIITTLFATDICTGNTIGNIEQVYTLGLFFAITRLISPLFWLLMAKIYGDNIDQFRGCMSISDVMEKLYGQTGRWITNIASISFYVPILSMEITAMGYLCNYFFHLPYLYCVIGSAIFIALYSSFGGIRAVAITDVFQFIVFMIAIPIACAFAYQDVGGYKGIVNVLPANMLKLDLHADNFWLFSSLIFYSLLPASAGSYIQRFLISNNAKQLSKCMKIIAVLHLFFSVIICLIGFIVKAKEPDINPNTAFIYFVENYIFTGLQGLVIAGLLAIMMSTADSWLNTASVLFAHDIATKVIRLTEKSYLLLAKISVFIIATLSAILALFEKRVLELEWLAGNFWAPIIVCPLISGFLKFRTNSKSFATAVISAISFSTISGYIVGDLATVSLMCGMIGSALGLFSMHYWQVHQGTLSVNAQSTKLTNTVIGKDANIDSKIALAASQGRHMFEDVEEQTKTISDELKKQSFIQGVEEGIKKGRLAEREEVARNLLLQGLDIGIIESATGFSREDLSALQKSIKTAN